MKTRFYLFLSMAFMLLILTGCIYDDNAVGPACSPAKTESLVINLNLSVPSAVTRTRSEGDDLVPGTKDESYINILDKDYQILLFDKDGDLVEGKLSDEFECKENGIKGGNVSYTLTGKLTLSDNEDREKLSKFQVMVLANWKSFEKQDFNYPSFKYHSLSENAENNIFKEQEKFNFTYTAAEAAEGNTSWMPSIPDRKAIPMFGITDKLDLQFVAEMGKYGDGPAFDVPMLRSLAKIEIRDAVPDGNAKIESCVLTYYNTTGRVIPDITDEANKDWADPQKMVSKPSLPSPVSTSTDLQFVKTTDNTIINNQKQELTGKDIFTVYIPEMDFSSMDRPEIRVKLEGSEQKYTIELSDYDENGKPKNGEEHKYTSLLRNHNYRFDITSVGSTELDFLVQTPWQDKDAGEWEYTDLKIEFESGKEFTWIFNTDEETKLPKFEGGEILDGRTIIITQDDWIEGSFKLISPAKAKWTISVYGDENTLNDHFYVETGTKEDMTDLEGSTFESIEWKPGGPSVSGNVGEEVLFRIIPSAVNNSNEHYVARVVFTITTFDDQIMEVNLPYYHEKNYEVTGSEMVLPSINNNGYYYVKQYYSGFKDVDDNEPERPGGIDGGNDSGGNPEAPDNTDEQP